MTRRSRRQREVGLKSEIKTAYAPPRISHAPEVAHNLSIRLYKYDPSIPNPIVLTKPLKPRAVSSSEDEDELEPVYPGPICISCSGIDNDPLIWCSGCCEPFHYECAKGFPKSKYGTTYKWFCLDCRQSCISCSYPVLTISTFECKSCWRIIHRRCIDPQLRSGFRTNGWTCSDCLRPNHEIAPRSTCEICLSDPLPHCQPSYQCDRCRINVNSCCLELSDDILHFYDNFAHRQIFLCENCDASCSWKNHLICAWRRSLLQILSPLSQLAKDHPEISSIQTNIDKFDSIESFAKELKALTSNEKFRSEEIQRKFEHSKNVLEQIFPNYDAHVAELPELEYPPEFTFHMRKAPVLPQFQTSLFRSPACCLCTAKPSYARLIYLGQDEWAHLACVLWAGRLANTKGNYSSMIRGYSHGIGPSAAREEESCRHCGYSIRTAISVKCAKEGCNLVMHFFCARLTGWLVMDKMTSLCGRHKPRCESKKNMVLEASLSRKISLESGQIAEPSLLADLIKQELPDNIAQDQNTPPSDTKPVIQQNVATGTTIVRPGITPLPKTGKPSSFDRQTSPVKVAPILSNVNLKPKSPSSGGKPQAFQQMMSSPPPLVPGKKAPLAQSADTQNSTLRELLRASPSQSKPIPASPLSLKSSPIAQQKVISPQQQQQQQRLKIIPIESQVNSQAMASNIMNKKPELQHFGQDKLSQLIETLFNEGPSSKPSSVNHFSANLIQSSNSSMPSTTTTQSQLPPNLTPKPFLNQSHVQSAPSATPVSEKVMPQLQRSVPNQNPPPLQQSASHKTPPKVQPSPFLDIPQTDGVIDLDQLSPALSDNNEDNEDSDFDISDDDAPLLPKTATETGDAEKRHKKPRAAYGSLKKKKITLEEVFTDVENMLLRKGRARPDHNDQAHHHKSKWAHGVRPEDAYIALGGLSVKNLGKIHPETTQCYKEALCPEGYEAVRWFWSAKNPGNLTKYILNVVVEHTPLPEAVYVNETIVHEPELVAPLPEEDISEASTPIACETITYTFEDFPEWQEAKIKEIAPPRTFLEARKRSAEIEASLIVPEKRGRRGRQKVIKKEVLETDDEDTEDILNRRSVRVWANKIKKEFVEEVVIPEELDGFKVPTDDEDDFEETVDPMDTSFKIEKEEPAKPLRVQSKRMSKFKNAPKRSSRSRRGRRNDNFSDEENDRNDEELHEVELIIDDFEGRSPDSDRPNNVEMMSLSDVRTLLRSDDEDDELIIKRKSRRMKLTSLDSDSESDEKSSQKSPELVVENNQEMSTLESIETVSIETDSKEVITIASSPDEPKEEPETIIVEPEVIESSPIDENEEDKRQYEADVLETVLENVDPEILRQARKVSTDSEGSKDAESLPKSVDEGETDVQKEENDTKIEESSVKDDQLEDELSTPPKISSDVDESEDKCESPSVENPTDDDARADDDDASTGIDENGAEIPQVEDPSADEDKSESIGEEPESVDEEIESSESSSVKDAAQSNSEQSPDAEDTENWSPDTEPENDMEDMFHIEEHDELDDASEKSSEQLAKELTQSFVRRSGRAVKSLPCAVKDCDKTFKDIEKILLHLKVNHPYHYAALITVKHSKVYKLCDTCGFIFMCKATFDSHLELSLCKRNLAYLKRYNEPEKFHELDFEVIENEYQWSYPKRKNPKRRTPTKPKKPVSPPKQNRRSNQKKEENLKTRSGRRVKVPQLDGNADSSDESSSRSGMEVDLPQTDGANDAQRIPAQQLPSMYQQMPPNQQQHTHNASPVFRMQPVMQQTNYIHVAKGGTVILPGGANQQNQVTHQHENQPLSGHQSNSPRVGAPQNGTPAPPGYYQVVNPQGEVIGQKPMMQNNHMLQQHPQQTQHRQLHQQPGQQIASHFPIFLTPGSSQGQPMSIQRVVAPAPLQQQQQQMRSATPQGYPQAATPTHRLTATPFDNRDILRTPLGSLGAPTPTPSFAMDQRMLEQQRLQEHRQRQQQQQQQQKRAMEEQRHREMQARAEEQHRRQEEERKRQEMIRKQREEEEKRRREEEKRQREEQQRQELIRKQQEERRILEEQHRKRMEHERLMQQQQQQEQQRRLMHQQQQQHQFHAQHQLQGLAHRQMSPGLQSPPQQQFQSQNRSPGSAHNLQSPPAQHNFQSPPLQHSHAQLATTPQQSPQIIQQPQVQNQQFLRAQNQQFFHNGQRFIRIQRHPQPAQTPTYINSNQRFVLASSQPVQMQQPQQMTFQQRPVASSPVNQTSQIANFANQQVIQNAKPPQYQEVQRQSSNQAPPQRYFNVGRSPKIDEYRLQQIKNDLKSPINAPTNITVKTEPPSSFQQPKQMPTMSNIYIKNEPIDEGYHKKVIKEAIQTQSELNMRKTTPPKHQAQMQNAAFGNQQFRVAPGAGPLPGLSVQHQRPSVLQHQRVQPMRVQQHVFRAYNPQNGTFTIQPQMTLAPRPAQRPLVSQVPGVPPQSDASLSAKKPWDLDLQPPRRQSGIEVVGRSPKQARPQQFQRYQVGTILPNNQGLKPGLNLINGQLIEVRNGPMPITGRQLSMDPSSFSVIKEEPKPIVFKQEPKMPKQPKVPKQKALIWDPIVLEESIVQGSVEDGFDDEFAGSILLDRLDAKKSQKCEKAEQRAETPEAVDELEEYNLSFSIVSEDGIRKTGRDLEKMWNEIIDELPTCGRLPGSAPRSTRPDVFAAFGFSSNMVRYLLEQLPLADSIPGSYKAVHFPRDEKSISVRRNSKGCWRAQGWSGKRNPQDMFSFLNSTHRSGLTHDQNFRPTMETDLPLTMRFRKMVETSRNSLQVLPSAIHGRGLFARRPYEPGELVIEYSGTVIRGELCDMREKYYDDRGIGTYMFRVDDDLVVDATMEGGRARFINHSCGPNCSSKIITVDSRKHICIIAGRFIDFGEELTYDYKFDRDFGSERIECGCQAPNCRRFMN